MRALSASDLLQIWERGASKEPVEQALAILSIAFPQAPGEALALLDFVQRDLCLLRLRGVTFGPQIKGVADCPVCGNRLELDFDARDLPAWTSPLPDFESEKLLNPETSLRVDDFEVTYRLPNSMDLSALSKVNDAGFRRQKLIEACIVSVQREDKTLLPSEIPSESMDVVVERMNREHPLADLTLSVTCPTCSHTWDILFDIVSYFWSEIHAWSMRLMQEVHTLAIAYGWREADILELSAWRRQRYLELIGVR